VIKGGPGTAIVDGDNGMGHLVMSFAANTAVEMARSTGLAWGGSRRSNHAGAAGVYAAIPLAHGMIGIYGAASSANHMAPWGGAEPLIGTNPIAFAIPAERRQAREPGPKNPCLGLISDAGILGSRIGSLCSPSGMTTRKAAKKSYAIALPRRGEVEQAAPFPAFGALSNPRDADGPGPPRTHLSR
jgi:hypothetical protein